MRYESVPIPQTGLRRARSLVTRPRVGSGDATEPRKHKHATASSRVNSLRRGLLVKTKVSPVLAVMTDILRKQSLQVSLVHRDHLVHEIVVPRQNAKRPPVCRLSMCR